MCELRDVLVGNYSESEGKWMPSGKHQQLICDFNSVWNGIKEEIIEKAGPLLRDAAEPDGEDIQLGYSTTNVIEADIYRAEGGGVNNVELFLRVTVEGDFSFTGQDYNSEQDEPFTTFNPEPVYVEMEFSLSMKKRNNRWEYEDNLEDGKFEQ